MLSIRPRPPRERATTEAAIAQAVNEFLQGDLLRQVNSAPQFRDDFGGKSNLTVKEALDRAATKVGQRFWDQPLVEAAIQTAIGQAYATLEENYLAVPHLERAVELRKHNLGSDHSETLKCLRSLAFVYEWVGRVDEAITVRKRLVRTGSRSWALTIRRHWICCAVSASPIGRQVSGDSSVRLLEQTLERSTSSGGRPIIERST